MIVVYLIGAVLVIGIGSWWVFHCLPGAGEDVPVTIDECEAQDSPQFRVKHYHEDYWVLQVRSWGFWRNVTEASVWLKSRSLNNKHSPMIGSKNDCVSWAEQLSKPGALKAYYEEQECKWRHAEKELAEIEAAQQEVIYVCRGAND